MAKKTKPRTEQEIDNARIERDHARIVFYDEVYGQGIVETRRFRRQGKVQYCTSTFSIRRGDTREYVVKEHVDLDRAGVYHRKMVENSKKRISDL